MLRSILAAALLGLFVAGCNFFAPKTQAAPEDDSAVEVEDQAPVTPVSDIDAGTEPDPDIWPPGPAPPEGSPSNTDVDAGTPEPDPDIWPPGPAPPEGQDQEGAVE